MVRAAFLVDGFNLYHSLRTAQRDLSETSTKWVDVHRLCSSYLHILGPGAELSAVHYFSALAKHLESTNPEVTARHRAFLTCLRDSGVSVHLSRFKKKTRRCPACRARITRYEEKETDVAIAAKLIELMATDRVDTAVLLSGDTDLAPAVRLAQELHPEKSVGFAFPYRRKNKELDQLADFAFQISKEQYATFQLPDPYTTKRGVEVSRPKTW